MYRNPSDIKRQTEYKADEAAGNCLSKYGVECWCSSCDAWDKAHDTVDGKQPNITAYDSLISDGQR